MKRKILTLLKYLSFFGLGVFLVWWSLQQISADKWKDFSAAFTSARYGLIIPVFFILFASHVLRSLRWKMLILPMGYNPSLINTFLAVMIGYLANLAVPRLGEVLKCTILAKYEHVPAEKLVGTIVAERAFDVLCLTLVFLLAFALQFDIIGEYGITLLKRVFFGSSGQFKTSALIVTIAILTVAILLIRFLFRRYANLSFIKKLKSIFAGIKQGITSAKDVKHKWLFTFATLGIWALYLFGTWLGFYATVGTTGLSLSVAVSALAFASIGMILTPGGIGAYALFMAKVLEKNGVPLELGLANGTLQWFAQFLIIICVGFISLAVLPYYNKNKA